jgi:predicted transcriptional regulator
MKYRSRMDIVASVLQSSMRGASKTKLMYSAYLSYAQLKEYLDFLQKRELLTYDQEFRLFRLTPKGLRFLNYYDEMKDVISLGPSQPVTNFVTTTQQNEINVIA